MLRKHWRVVKSAIARFAEDGCTQLAAALSYYTVFSLPPLLMIVVMLTGPLLGEKMVETQLLEEIRGFVGTEGGQQIETMLHNAQQVDPGGAVSWLLSSLAFLFGATAALSQLQTALNVVWNVRVDPEASVVKSFLMKRLLSVGMMLTIGFLLMVSLVLSAVISWAGSLASDIVPRWTSKLMLQGFELGGSVILFTLLFGAIFVVLPDAVVAWRDVWVGAFVTALLLVLGKFAIGFYLGRTDPGGWFGAAGSLALVLVWVYLASMIFLFGAELTQAWAAERNREIVPEEGAVWAGRGDATDRTVPGTDVGRTAEG